MWVLENVINWVQFCFPCEKSRIKNATFSIVGRHLCYLDSKRGSDVTLDKDVRQGRSGQQQQLHRNGRKWLFTFRFGNRLTELHSAIHVRAPAWFIFKRKPRLALPWTRLFNASLLRIMLLYCISRTDVFPKQGTTCSFQLKLLSDYNCW